MYEHCKSCVHDKGAIGFCDKCSYTYMHRKYGLSPTEYEAKPKPITNADRLRSMSDEELAAFKAQITDGRFYCFKDGVLYEAKVEMPKGKVYQIPPMMAEEAEP